MVFSSLQFIFLFMPIFFGCYYIVPDKIKNFILFIGSLCFYFVGTIHNPEHFILFILSIVLDFAIGIWIEKYPARKKVLLTVGVILHLISLTLFKYSSFVINEIGRFNPNFDFTADIILPIGISFYTFQGISYIVDVYRGTTKAQQSLLKYTIYISMFEQLIAGPIVTYGQVEKELYKRQIKTLSVLKGIGVFVFGLGLKVLLANPIGKLWSQTCAIGFESISTPLAWMAIIAFSFQIYFDFFGYSLMAIWNGDVMIKLTPFSINDDFEIVYKAFSNENTQSLISNRVIIKSKELFRDWLIFQLQNYYHEFKIVNYNDEKIGFCYSYEYIDGTVKTVMYIKDDYQNSGVGVLAEITFIDYLFKLYPIRKIYNHVYSYNEQSLNSHLKAGFNTEGKLIKYRYYAGHYHDVYILSITKENFYSQYENILTCSKKG